VVKSWSEPEAMTKARAGERDQCPAGKPAKSEERRTRLEKELRANLLKRKAQTKARLKTATTEAEDGH
jgi:hypothetical protein